MHRLLDALALLIAALWPANRRPSIQDTPADNGPQALPAVETPRQTTPAQTVELPRQTAPAQATVSNNPGPHRATASPALHRLATAPPAATDGLTTKSNPDPGQRSPASRFVGTGRDGTGR